MRNLGLKVKPLGKTPVRHNPLLPPYDRTWRGANPQVSS